MIGFFGLSAPQLCLMRWDTRRKKSLISLVSGSSNVIRETREHLLYLEDLLKTFTFSYNDPKVRALESKIRRASRNDTGSSAFSSVATQSVEELQKELDVLLTDPSIKKTLTNSFINVENKKVVLSSEAFIIMESIIESLPKRVELLSKLMIETPVLERRIFGRTPTSVFLRPVSMEEGFFQIISNNRQRVLPFEVLRRLRKELENIEELVHIFNESKDNSFVSVSREKVTELLKPNRFLEYTKSLGLPEDEIAELEEFFLELSGEFKASIRYITDKISESELEHIIGLFYEILLLDNSKTYLNDLLGVNGFELDRLDLVFEELNDIGLFFFTRKNSVLFFQMLSSLVVGRNETLASLDSNDTRDGRSFLDVYEEIKKAFLSLSPSGSVRGNDDAIVNI